LSDEDWSEETYYGIEILRLERWVLRNIEKLNDPVLLKEIAHEKNQAERVRSAYASLVPFADPVVDPKLLDKHKEDFKSVFDHIDIDACDPVGAYFSESFKLASAKLETPFMPYHYESENLIVYAASPDLCHKIVEQKPLILLLNRANDDFKTVILAFDDPKQMKTLGHEKNTAVGVTLLEKKKFAVYWVCIPNETYWPVPKANQ